MKALRGNSNKFVILKRADGWWKSVNSPCESILEQSMESNNFIQQKSPTSKVKIWAQIRRANLIASKYFRFKPLLI